MPERMAGRSGGSSTRRNTVKVPAPSVRAASSSAGSCSSSTGSTARTTKGTVMKRSASTMLGVAKATGRPWAWSQPPRADWGPKRSTSITPVTSVGMAKGRSTRPERSPRPGNS